MSFTTIKNAFLYTITSPYYAVKNVFLFLKQDNELTLKEKVNSWRDYFIWRNNKPLYENELIMLARLQGRLNYIENLNLNSSQINANNCHLLLDSAEKRLAAITPNILYLQNQPFTFHKESKEKLLACYVELSERLCRFELPLIRQYIANLSDVDKGHANKAKNLEEAYNNLEEERSKEREAMLKEFNESKMPYIQQVETKDRAIIQLQEEVQQKEECIQKQQVEILKLTEVLAQETKICTKLKEDATFLQEMIRTQNQELADTRIRANTLTSLERDFAVLTKNYDELKNNFEKKREEAHNELKKSNQLSQDLKEIETRLNSQLNVSNKQALQIEALKRSILKDESNNKKEIQALAKQLTESKKSLIALRQEHESLLNVSAAFSKEQVPYILQTETLLKTSLSNLETGVNFFKQNFKEHSTTMINISISRDHTYNLIMKQTQLENALADNANTRIKLREDLDNSLLNLSYNKESTKLKKEIEDYKNKIKSSDEHSESLAEDLYALTKSMQKEEQIFFDLNEKNKNLMKDLNKNLEETETSLKKAQAAYDDFKRLTASLANKEEMAELENLIKTENRIIKKMTGEHAQFFTTDLKKQRDLDKKFKENLVADTLKSPLQVRHLAQQVSKDIPRPSLPPTTETASSTTTMEEVD